MTGWFGRASIPAALVIGAALLTACGSSAPTDATASKANGDAPSRAPERLENPYVNDAAAIAEGKELFVAKACASCHGPNAEGGLCPPLSNDRWVYGSDDTTLFNLIKLGSVAFRAQGHARSTREKAVGDMPPFAAAVSDEEAWKLIAYVRSKYAGDPSARNW